MEIIRRLRLLHAMQDFDTVYMLRFGLDPDCLYFILNIS